MKKMVIAVSKAGTGNVVALVLGAISMKIVAVIAGPSGVGLFSLLRSLQQTLTTISSFGGHTAIVQAIPGKQRYQRERFLVSVFWIFVSGFMLVASISAIFANTLAAHILSADKAYLIRWLTVPIIFGAMFLYFRAILTAHLEIGAVVWVNVLVGLASVVVAVPAALGYAYSDASALILLLAFPLAVGAILAFVKACKGGHLTGPQLLGLGLFEWCAAKQFLCLAFPSLLVGLIGMASVMLIRVMVARHYGLDGAGYYDAGWAISAMYLTIFLSAMQSYLLPSISGEREKGEMHKLLVQALQLAIIISVPLITFMIVSKPFILKVLYSSEFSPALDLLRWTLLGDYLRVFGWTLATYLLARIDMKAYLIHEALWNFIFVIVGIWLLETGLAGLGKAYLAAYSIYLAALLWRIYAYHGVRVSWVVVAEWGAGGGVILLAGLVTWDAVTLDWAGGVALILAMGFSLFIMRPNERKYLKRFLFGLVRRLS